MDEFRSEIKITIGPGEITGGIMNDKNCDEICDVGTSIMPTEIVKSLAREFNPIGHSLTVKPP